MLEIQAQITERVLKLTAVPMIPSGSINNIKFILTLDSEWIDLDCTLVCYSDVSNPYYEPIINGSAIIPHEVLADPGIVCFGVFGTFGDRRITSTIDKCKIKQGAITDGLHPSEPSTDVWQYLLSQYAEIKKLTQTTLQTAESAIKIATDKAAEANTSAQTAVESAQQAQASQEAADISAKSAADANANAQQSATDAARSAQQVQQSVIVAENAANRAEQAATDISAAVTQVQNAAQAAQQSATQAQEHAKSASNSAASAAQAQQGAIDAETSARQSADAAQKSQQTATQSATEAGKSAQQAAGAQTAAQNSATAADTSAKKALESQTAAAGSATSAQESVTEATRQATASEASAVRAEKAATEAEQSVQQIAGVIDKLAIHTTSSGNPAVIRDGADWQMEGLRVYGQSNQVTTTGAQMLDATKRIVGSVINNGVQSSNSRYACSDFIDIPQGTSNIYQSGGALNQRGFYDADKAFISNPGPVNNATVPENAKYIRISSDIDKQDMGNIMLCVGNTAKPYEPYTGGKPAPSPEYPQEIVSREVSEIMVTGKNLLNHGSLSFTHFTKIDLTNVLYPGTYTFSGVATTEAESDSLLISCLDGAGKLVVSVYLPVGGRKHHTVSISRMVAGLQVYAARSNAQAIGKSAQISDLQLELGAAATPFEPYRAQTVKLSAPVTLRGVPVTSAGNVSIDDKQYIADCIVWKDGVIGVQRNVIEAKLSVSDMNNAETHPGWKGTGIVPKLKNPPANTICNVFGENGISFNFSNDILFTANRDMQQSEWKKRYPNLVFEIWMIAASSTFTPLPEPDQQAIRTLRTYHGNTVVTAGAHTEVNYVADPKLYINNIVNTISEVKSKIIELESKV